VGLITSLLTLPLAPVRGTARLASVIEQQAENEAYDESAIRDGLAELDAAREAGMFTEEEIQDAEDAMVERLIDIRGVGGPESHGELG
jgi:hypothetical protein